MNSFPKFHFMRWLKLGSTFAALVFSANHVFATAEETYLTANNYSGSSDGGSFTVSATINSDNNCSGISDQIWNSHTSGSTQVWCLNLAGSGSHPITSSDVDYPVGTASCLNPNVITFPPSGRHQPGRI